MTVRDPAHYESGEFHEDTNKRLLLRNGDSVAVTPKVFDTLLYLLQHQGEVVEKSDLMRVIWPDTAVEENNLSQNISTLRRILGENRGANLYIATVPGKGYRFTAAVEAVRGSLEGLFPKMKLAVLPIEKLSADPHREYLADGLTEETSASLGQIDTEPLSVIGRTSEMAYK